MTDIERQPSRKPLRSRPQSVEYLKDRHGVTFKTQTLAKKAVDGTGPKFFRLGSKVYYSEEHLDEWIAERMSPPVRSTTELAQLSERQSA